MTVTCLFCGQDHTTSQDFTDHVHVCRWFRLARGSLRTMTETPPRPQPQPDPEPGDPQPQPDPQPDPDPVPPERWFHSV